LGLAPHKKLILAPVHKSTNTRKGFVFAAHALAHLHEKLSPQQREDTVVAVFGQVDSDGADKMPYPFETVKLGFIKNEETKARIYKAADVTLVPSMQESLSVIASDSIRHGTPVACFDTSGLAYFVRHRANGFLARPYDAEDLSRGLYWAFFQSNAPAVRKAAIQLGRELFDPKTNTELFEGAIANAIEKYHVTEFDKDFFQEISEFTDKVSEVNRFHHIYRRNLEKKAS
ncbi:unnamed protein product, partial [Ectocarpus sp. 12 AP-2014]